MSFPTGNSLGPYDILSRIGAGGMGEVYRAKDRKLDREVAIKVMPPGVAQSPERLARFEREAKVLAALNHPNIAQIYGVEESGGVSALVMELVPGDMLKGPLPLDAALDVARQIADALEAAHEKGIVHRDLKPANVMITPTGVVKVLDFGLAAVSAASANSTIDPVNSPTISMAATQAGLIMGTAGYMSPEQAVGKPVDRRADIWSFGVVLFEMLAGPPLFGGETVSHVLADVIRADIDFRRLPESTPAQIRDLLKRCLDREVKNRLRDIGEARIAIQKYLADPSSGLTVSAQTPPPTKSSRLPWAVAAASTILAIGLGAIVWRNPTAEPARAVWLSLPVTKEALRLNEIPATAPSVAVSPDGRRIVFEAMNDGKAALWIRDLDSPDLRMLAGTEHGRQPFWSPDSRFIAFTESRRLKKIAAAGGPAIAICDIDNFEGGSWGQNDVILFGSSTGVQRVSAMGGTPAPIIEIDRSRGEDAHRRPWFLPDGRHFLYTATLGDRSKSSVFVGDLASKERKQVLDAVSNAVYAGSGHLLFVRNRTLMAQSFDLVKLQTTKEAVPIADKVSYVGNNALANFAASQTGVLVYTASDLSQAELTWFDRSGKILGTVGAPGELEFISLSPDDTAVVAVRSESQNGTSDLWRHDFARHVDTRLTFTGANRFPSWSPDGAHIAYSGARNGSRSLYQIAANGAGQEELLEAGPKLPADWSRDGRYLITMTTSQNPKTGNDIWVLPLLGDRKPFPYLQTEFAEFFARLSPDGKWLAYTSNESGHEDVYVVGFPGHTGKWQISTTGGSRPVWSRDNRELYFLDADRKIAAVEIKSGATFQAGAPKSLFEVRFPRGNTNFAVTKDGRFLIPALVQESDIPVTVVFNWTGLLSK